MTTTQPCRVGLFVTCLVDVFRPAVGFAAVKLLQDAGCSVEVPAGQTCCGQPAYNSGDRADSKALARQVLDAFEEFDYVIAPSGSCSGMIKEHYPALFADDPALQQRAQALADKTFELISFLVDVRGMENIVSDYAGSVTYHDSCAGLRELGIKQQPRTLLKTIPGLELREMDDSEVCCGFGGTFCIKYPDISNRMVSDKIANIQATGADLLLAGDLGCLLNMAGKLKRVGSPIQVRHVAEILAGDTDTPPLGDS
ncbi:MAG: (Fe-S)-binding protein [Gammaproteobacteria bacterium]